ncbi:MAG TPA: DNA-formamidopyrimidine glycosylase family protein [Edaphocola sp.]|nr:DNA-formamidopyrimidine glycosylase family protein [Edaphocola sp.]
MPEGPSIVIMKEDVYQFEGKEVLEISGNSKIDKIPILNQKVIAFKSWGKHFLICFEDFTVRIHLLLFGSYRVNEKKETPERLHFQFENGELNFYACSVKMIEGNINQVYDFSADVMNEHWNPKAAKKKLKTIPKTLICDALLKQEIFAGVGNIIKNEVLYRVRVHPKSEVGAISIMKLNQIIKEAKNYSFDFLEWKKEFTLKKNWLAHTKKICLRCNKPIIKEYTGVYKRRSFFCTNCQKLYTFSEKVEKIENNF